MIPGHEMVGYVAALGQDVTGLAVGDLVASGAGISCGHCRLCRAGRTSLCETYVTVGLQRHGALAQYVAVPASTCVDVSPYQLDPVTAALAQPMAIAVHSLRRGRAQAPDVAAVVGVGGIGAFLVFALARSGVQVVAADLAIERRDLAVRLGAVAGLDPRAAAVVDGGTGALPQVDVVFEVTGTPSGLETALAWATPGTRIVLVGLQKDSVSVDARRVSLTELELIGTNAHAVRDDLPEALRLLGLRAEGWRDVAPDLLTLDDLVAQGLEPMARGESSRIKTLVDPWADESGPVP
jgi:(R,R)-butanediol dehydrogenase/meso-butanediol dehydrogenase/diacetyl reductase